MCMAVNGGPRQFVFPWEGASHNRHVQSTRRKMLGVKVDAESV